MKNKSFYGKIKITVGGFFHGKEIEMFLKTEKVPLSLKLQEIEPSEERIPKR